jgi:Rieske Fe-S protein
MSGREIMDDEEQERFEDYLELERYIEELQAGRAAHPPRDLTPAQARIYRMAALFRSASPQAALPRSEFIEELHARLLALDHEDHEEEETQKRPAVKPQVEQPQPAAAQAEPEKVEPAKVETSQEQEAPANAPRPATPAPDPAGVPRRAHFFSRRSLLSGGAAAAASLVVGAGIGAAIEGAGKSGAQKAGSQTPVYTPPVNISAATLVPDNIPTVLHFVINEAELGEDAVSFNTGTIIGFVIRSDGDDPDVPKGIIAMSAACTHMGCIVQWDGTDRQYHCPCHGGVFSEYGKPANSIGHMRYPAALPRLNTKVIDGKIYVQVPAGPSQT